MTQRTFSTVIGVCTICVDLRKVVEFIEGTPLKICATCLCNMSMAFDDETRIEIAQRLRREGHPVDILFVEIARAVLTFKSDLDWEEKYDKIFERAPRVRELCREAGRTFEYCDPDTSYEEDVRAYVEALRELKGRLDEEEVRA